jgi:uncharacterized metal-binding protein YceD (DUF177 family)
MNPQSLIWIDRLKNGKVQLINESFDPAFLDIQEEELRPHSSILATGEAYLTENELIVKLQASTDVMMPCAVCNQMIPKTLAIKDFYHAQPITEIPSAVFDFQPFLREALLLELPHYAECNQGKCPERGNLTPYLKVEQEKNNFPFSNLDS